MTKSNIVAAILLVVGLGCFFNPFSGMIGEIFLPILAFILIVLGALPCAINQSFE